MTTVPWEWLSELWQKTEGGGAVNLHFRTPPPCVSAQHVPFCRPAPLLLLLHCLTSAVDLPLKCRSIRFPTPQGCGAAFNWLLSQGRLPLPHPPGKVRECGGNGNQHKVKGNKHQPDVNVSLDNPKSSIINQLSHAPHTKVATATISSFRKNTHAHSHTHKPLTLPSPIPGRVWLPVLLGFAGLLFEAWLREHMAGAPQQPPLTPHHRAL